MGIDEFFDVSRSGGGLVVCIAGIYPCLEVVEQGDDPSVDLGALIERHFCFAVNKAVDVGIEGKKRIGIVQGAEGFSFYFFYPGQVKFEVVPGGCIGDHVPAGSIGAVGTDGVKRIDHIAEAFRHFHAVFIEHEAIGDHVFVGYTVKDHGGDGVEGVKPTPRLVHSFCNEVGRE